MVTNQGDDRIRFYCTSHPTQLAIVTLHERQWAYCPGGYVAEHAGHVWTAIPPTQITQVHPSRAGLVVVAKAGRGI